MQIGAIKALDRRIGLRVACHFDKTKALGFTSELIGNEIYLGNFTKTGKAFTQIRTGNVVRKIAYEDIHRYLSLKCRALVRMGTIEKNQAQESLRQRDAVVPAKGGRGTTCLVGKSVGFRRNR